MNFEPLYFLCVFVYLLGDRSYLLSKKLITTTCLILVAAIGMQITLNKNGQRRQQPQLERVQLSVQFGSNLPNNETFN